MLFELAGFLCGVMAIAAAFRFLYLRDSSRVMQGIYGPGRCRQGA